jgi:hypothetical protein
MTTLAAAMSPLTTARVAGFLYLLTVPLGIFTLMVVPSTLIVAGSAAATAANIVAQESLLRLSIVSALIGSVIGIVYVLVLYKLLRPAGRDIAVLMVVLALTGNPIAMLSELAQLGVLQLLGNADYLAVFSTAQLQALAYLFGVLHTQGVYVSFIFAGLWLLPLGYLVFASGFLPRILGVLLILGGIGYLTDVFAGFLVPESNLKIGLFTGLAEIVFLAWLLIRGVDVERWKERALDGYGTISTATSSIS